MNNLAPHSDLIWLLCNLEMKWHTVQVFHRAVMLTMLAGHHQVSGGCEGRRGDGQDVLADLLTF